MSYTEGVVLLLITMSCCTATHFMDGFEGGRQEDAISCTNGFMSVDRINAVLDNYGSRRLSEPYKDLSIQVVFPAINFTCGGNILKWVFGAHWEGKSAAFTELQIWRSSENGLYNKVGSTTVMTEENTAQLYQYHLSPPLPFQAGDILGYYQGAAAQSQLRLMYEDTESRWIQSYYIEQDNPQTQFSVENGTLDSDYHVLIGIETGKLCMLHAKLSVCSSVKQD